MILVVMEERFELGMERIEEYYMLKCQSVGSVGSVADHAKSAGEQRLAQPDLERPGWLVLVGRRQAADPQAQPEVTLRYSLQPHQNREQLEPTNSH